LPEGNFTPSTKFQLKNSQGRILPVQSWPLAYWPDGSLKWVGLSTVVDSAAGMTFELEPVKTKVINNNKTKIEITETENDILINTGALECNIPKHGNQLIRFIKIEDKEISTGGKLICIWQNGPSTELGEQPIKEKFISSIKNVTVEQRGPIRPVIKIEGNHISESGNRNWLPFIIRFYFYAGTQSIRIVHTIIYDGDQQKDFIRGLGLVFDVPLDEQLYNRHIRFSGDDGRLWDEPCQPLNGRFPLDRDEDIYARQLIG